MFIDLTKDEKDVLKMIAGQPMPHIVPGARLNQHVSYLKNCGLIQAASSARYSSAVAFELSREGKTYLKRHP